MLRKQNYVPMMGINSEILGPKKGKKSSGFLVLSIDYSETPKYGSNSLLYLQGVRFCGQNAYVRAPTPQQIPEGTIKSVPFM